MNEKEIGLILREVEVQMEKIKAAELSAIRKFSNYYVGNPKWGIYKNDSEYLSRERAELDRTMMNLQRNLGRLRRAMYAERSEE